MEAATSAAQTGTNLPPLGQVNEIRLGEVLVQQGLISREQLQQTLELQQQTGKKLGDLLVESGSITNDLFATIAARKLHVPFVNLKTFSFRTDLVMLLPELVARRLHALALDDKEGTLQVALTDPLNLAAINELTALLKRPIIVTEVRESDLALALEHLYEKTPAVSEYAEHTEHTEALAKDVDVDVDFNEGTNTLGSESAPVARLLRSLFESAIRMGASDVHVEPQENGLQVRVRLDGVLHIQMVADRRSGAALTQRVKLMAGLDISEKRLPQDGSFSVRMEENTIDVRLSTLPTIYGESLVMRILSQNAGIRSLDDIGMPEAMLKRFREVLSRNLGLVLVTGPTGSGKTTTLYAALSEINTVDLKIISVEDPVEYRLPGITQIQVNDKIELSFSRVLRSILRQDPDVLLVGEIRDVDTAGMCMRSAMTGHLVLSTLHTRDAMSAPFRLIDMMVPPFMVATSLQAVIAQRLLRLNCVECSEPHVANPQEQLWLSTMLEAGDSVTSLCGVGCEACSGTGYAGRRGVYEWLEMDAVLTNAASHTDPTDFMKVARERLKGQTLADHALNLVREGRTSLAEALRVGAGVGEQL